MLRPNMAMDAPPESIEVGGAKYRVDTDYRVWLRILELTRELYCDARNEDDALHNVKVILDMERIAFGGVLSDESPAAALKAMNAFLRGYPEPPTNGNDRESESVLNFGWDINYIILAIRNQGGPDLSYRREEPFHWWEFLLETRAICGEHYITRLMRIRGFEDASKKSADWHAREAMRLKRLYALPYEMNADERRRAEEFDKLTGGG